jgi:hypothetical protein
MLKKPPKTKRARIRRTKATSRFCLDDSMDSHLSRLEA